MALPKADRSTLASEVIARETSPKLSTLCSADTSIIFNKKQPVQNSIPICLTLVIPEKLIAVNDLQLKRKRSSIFVTLPKTDKSMLANKEQSERKLFSMRVTLCHPDMSIVSNDWHLRRKLWPTFVTLVISDKSSFFKPLPSRNQPSIIVTPVNPDTSRLVNDVQADRQ